METGTEVFNLSRDLDILWTYDLPGYMQNIAQLLNFSSQLSNKKHLIYYLLKLLFIVIKCNYKVYALTFNT